MSRPLPFDCRAVVFDVDGTLYEQRPLRRRMLLELARYCLAHPGDWRLPWRLQRFRRERERLSIEEIRGVAVLQFERPAKHLGVSPACLEREVGEWIERRPLAHLAACRVPGVRRIFDRLRGAGVALGILSDYPAAAKLAALGLSADVIVAAVDPGVDRFKPHPAGLREVLARLGAEPGEALLIGDRDDRDGESARRAGVAYLLRGPASEPAEGRFRDFTELLSAGG